MKIYNRKGLIWGILWTVLAGFNLINNIISPADFLPEQMKDITISVIILAIGITGFIRAFSKKATMEDKLEEQDERNKLISLKSKAKVLDVLKVLLFIIAAIALGFAYMSTKNIGWIHLLTVAFISWGVISLLELITAIYYEKHI